MTAGLVLDVLSCVINDSINTGFNLFNVSLRSSSALKKTKTFIYYFLFIFNCACAIGDLCTAQGKESYRDSDKHPAAAG